MTPAERELGQVLLKAWRNTVGLYAAELAKLMTQDTNPGGRTTVNPHPNIGAPCRPHSTRWCATCNPTGVKPHTPPPVLINEEPPDLREVLCSSCDSDLAGPPYGPCQQPTRHAMTDDPAALHTSPIGDPLNGTGPGELVIHFSDRGGLLGVTFHGEPMPYRVDSPASIVEHVGPDNRPIVVRRAA